MGTGGNNGSMMQMGMQGTGMPAGTQGMQQQSQMPNLQSMMQQAPQSMQGGQQQTQNQFTSMQGSPIMTPFSGLQGMMPTGPQATPGMQPFTPFGTGPSPVQNQMQTTQAPAPTAAPTNMASTLPGMGSNQSAISQWWQQNQGKNVSITSRGKQQEQAITGTAPNSGIWNNYLKNFGWSNTPVKQP